MKKTLLFLGLFLSSLSSFAQDNVLQTIEIVPVKDTYNIVLVSDRAVDVRKTVQASNKITLNLKDIRASKSLNTVYNNVSNVDTVMVEPSGSGLNIFFQAENAQGTSVSFDALEVALPPARTQTQKLKLSAPVESYAPIYKEELAQEKTSDLFNRLKQSSTVANIKESIEESTLPDSMNKMISFGLISLLAFAIIRLFKRKEPEMKIGLSQSLNEREIEMYRGQQPIGSSYVNLEKPYTTMNYGINAYQRESRNPYESEAPVIHNPRLRNYTNVQNQNLTQSVMQPMAQQQVMQTIAQPQVTQPIVQQALKKHTTPVNVAPVNQNNPNIDNLKFLESMTAIYEKSGRHDLARGLKASLNKNNIK